LLINKIEDERKLTKKVEEMDAIDKVRMMADLHRDHCSLNHGPDTNNQRFPVADYIVMSFGYEEKKDMEIAVRELVIPVCFECVSALKGNEWTLLYCFECTHNRWVCRKLAKNNYRHHILWLRGCPDCTNKFGGLYFTDMSAYKNAAILALNEIRKAV
jgi:hypothetical protein